MKMMTERVQGLALGLRETGRNRRGDLRTMYREETINAPSVIRLTSRILLSTLT
jgi:hypothetical protein